MKSTSSFYYIKLLLYRIVVGNSRQEESEFVKLAAPGVFFDAGPAAWEKVGQENQVHQDVDWR